MTNPIQIPYLRPDPVHEGAGLEQAGGEDQMGQLAKLLMLKGHLALEQEKFQAEEQERKQKKQALTQAGGTLSQLLSQPGVMDDPSKFAGAIGQAAGPLTAAGAGPEATGLLKEVPGLQQQARLSATQRALGTIIDQYKSGDLLDEKNQARTYAQLYAIDDKAAQSFAEGIKSLNGRFTFWTDSQGQHYIGDTQRGTEHKGLLGAPKSGVGGVPMTTKEAQVAARIGLNALVDMRNVLNQFEDADITPLLSAGLAGAKAGGGVLGAVAGFAQPFAEMAKDPHQQLFGSAYAAYKEAYMSVITGKRGVGSPALGAVIDNAFIPLGGQVDKGVRASKTRRREQAYDLLGQLASGKAINMDLLPGYREAVREGLGLPIDGSAPPPATPNMPGGLGQAPLGFDDLLKGVPPVDRKP